MNVIDWCKNKSKLIDENTKIRKGKHEVEKKFNEMLEDMNEIEKKYIELLEKKSEQFDLYLKYQGECKELANEKKDLKKQLANSQERCLMLTAQNNDLSINLEKLEKKVKALTSKK